MGNKRGVSASAKGRKKERGRHGYRYQLQGGIFNIYRIKYTIWYEFHPFLSRFYPNINQEIHKFAGENLTKWTARGCHIYTKQI